MMPARKHQVVLAGLDDEHARIDLAGQTHEVGIGELSRYWFGDFVMLWRPGTQKVKPLSVGMRGDEVRWLRESLERLQGVTAGQSVSDVFDTELSHLVMDFQRQHRLAVDGIAGIQTQIVLASAVAGTGLTALERNRVARQLTHVLHPRCPEEIRKRPPAPERACFV